MTDITIYTDGSYDPIRRVGGWAAVILIQDEKIILKGRAITASHQRMELEAVIQALRYLEKDPIPESSMKVYSDSQYVIGIQERKEKIKRSGFLTGKKVKMRNDDLVALLIRYLDKWGVTLVKVKAHQKSGEGQDFNREVDKLSRKIVRHGLRQPE